MSVYGVILSFVNKHKCTGHAGLLHRFDLNPDFHLIVLFGRFSFLTKVDSFNKLR
jgi:hypothetical protein